MDNYVYHQIIVNILYGFHYQIYHFISKDYGKTWINANIDQIVEWRFKIINMDSDGGIAIGLVSTDNRLY